MGSGWRSPGVGDEFTRRLGEVARGLDRGHIGFGIGSSGVWVVIALGSDCGVTESGWTSRILFQGHAGINGPPVEAGFPHGSMKKAQAFCHECNPPTGHDPIPVEPGVDGVVHCLRIPNDGRRRLCRTTVTRTWPGKTLNKK